MDIHLVGIGGGGMCGLAAMLQRFGARVSGSDQVAFEGVGPLVAAGASVWIGHRPELMDPRLDLVVTSAAVPETNAELVAARARGLPVLKYAEMIGRVMATQGRGIAVAGTHGKSTTTAMCVHLCRSAGLDPSFLFGATSAQLGGGSHVGTGEPFIVEACEFDRSFLHLRPESAAILNIEPDHLDCYHDLDDLTDAFRDFARFVAADGLIVYQDGNPATERAVSAAAAAKQSFGFGEQADWRALNLRHTRGCFSFVIQFRGSPVISSSLSIPGRYNVSNALAAVALAYHAGVDFKSMAESLPRFEGIARRMALRGEGRGVTILDDYAHHP
ncbi:MAG: UDP-N-acetylmuramate--L-alanine ligase, partial [Phycisphaerae bacterium]